MEKGGEGSAVMVAMAVQATAGQKAGWMTHRTGSLSYTISSSSHDSI